MRKLLGLSYSLRQKPAASLLGLIWLLTAVGLLGESSRQDCLLSMKAVLRVDASLKMGTGHVMRCLTLANALRAGGAEVSFNSRKLKGNLIDRIEREGFAVAALPAPEVELVSGPPAHAGWAEVSWQQDAEETKTVLEAIQPDWLIVDHYAFDRRWEQFVRDSVGKLMVIDDLADRPHDCELLLEQNLGREAQDYDGLVPKDCRLLIGPRYALLRPEFAARRAESLKRRQSPKLENVLVSMGGVDANNVTAEVLKALEASSLPESCSVTVVLGAHAPWVAQVKALAAKASRCTRVICDVQDMAGLMSKADLAIGAAGSTSWERCCLGVPAILITLAENQQQISYSLGEAGAALAIGSFANAGLSEAFSKALQHLQSEVVRQNLSEKAANICDGGGTGRVYNEILPPDINFRRADISDSRRIWEWRRFPGYERFSKKGLSPSFSEHDDWFCAALEDPSRTFSIVSLGLLPCGYFRLDCQAEGRAAISICLSADARGRGLARHVLAAAEKEAAAVGATVIDAEVHAENVPSLRAFSSAGYRRIGESDSFVQLEQLVGGVA